jgi:hypothetical protein
MTLLSQAQNNAAPAHRFHSQPSFGQDNTDEVGRVLGPQLLQDIGAMKFDGARAYSQSLRGLLA